jgi:2-polyprenyl-3-methyl-5-hydroxy-6-metoxy-1,4-benzoquinol methylase
MVVECSRQLERPPTDPNPSRFPIGLDNLDDDCRRVVGQKYGEHPTAYIASRLQAGYFSPEDHYEALLQRLVRPDSVWLDVGCGHAPFPNNLALSRELADRCRMLVGIDPDENVHRNEFVHQRFQTTLEHYSAARTFDLVTARMVVEHVTNPRSFTAALSRTTHTGSVVVIFTVNWWSVTALAATCSPTAMHHWAKRLLWNSDRRDTFPTAYRLNRRRRISSMMAAAGFREGVFLTLPDASLFWRVPKLRTFELKWYSLLKRLRAPYIDSCILATYERT